MKVVFLDRDGVINEILPGSYVKKISEFKFLPGVVEAISNLSKEGLPSIIISNQAGVGKGLMTSGQLAEIDRWMVNFIRARGGMILKTYYCPHPSGSGCACRKPQPGLLLKAARDFDVDLKGSYFVGDNISDIKAGCVAGCRTVLVLSGLGALQVPLLNRLSLEPFFIAPSLLEASEQIIHWEKGGR